MNYFFHRLLFLTEPLSGRPSVVSTQYHASLRHLSRAVFVNFELVESAVPPVGEVEDRHVEYKHRIMHSPAAPERFSPFARQTLSLYFHFCFSSTLRFPHLLNGGQHEPSRLLWF